MSLVTILDAAHIIRQGGVVAYPTESCYGLGCDPANGPAVRRILSIKRRHFRKGLILVADHLIRLRPYFREIPDATREAVLSSWPGPCTWLLPSRRNVSRLLRGNHELIAVRVSRHRVVRMLCRETSRALISTSANRAGRPAIRSLAILEESLGHEVDGIVEGDVGRRKNPSTIRNALDGSCIRV